MIWENNNQNYQVEKYYAWLPVTIGNKSVWLEWVYRFRYWYGGTQYGWCSWYYGFSPEEAKNNADL